MNFKQNIQMRRPTTIDWSKPMFDDVPDMRSEEVEQQRSERLVNRLCAWWFSERINPLLPEDEVALTQIKKRLADDEKSGNSPLRKLCTMSWWGFDDRRKFQFYIELGADINTMDDGHESSLLIGCIHQCNPLFVNNLLVAGVDVNYATQLGYEMPKTALDVATDEIKQLKVGSIQFFQMSEIIESLKDYGAKHYHELNIIHSHLS